MAVLARDQPRDRERAQTLLSEARVLSKAMGLHGQIQWIEELEAEATVGTQGRQQEAEPL